jgi:xanthine/uracil permease
VSGPGATWAACPVCGAKVKIGKTTISVEGKNAGEVLMVASALSAEAAARESDRVIRKSPWATGSFYLAAVVVIVLLILAVAKTVSAWVLPPMVVGTVILLSVIGALQLRHDGALSEKNFLALMYAAFKRLPMMARLGGAHAT